VIADGGLDRFEGLLNDVPVAPFTMTFGNQSFLATDLTPAQFYARLKSDTNHPTTSQPTPQQFAELYRAAGETPVLCVTISGGLSGSMGSAEAARALVPEARVTIHDSRSISAAQAFQVHAAERARQLGHSLDTACAWMKQVADGTELYFTLDDLTYLQRGGRIGRVAAALGGLLNLKPIIAVDKTSGTYQNIGRARAWGKAVAALADRVTARFGAGTPLRLGLLYGGDQTYAEELLEHLNTRHPILWVGHAAVNPVLGVHIGPKTVGLAAAAGPWPWES
jgi:DegV family protein with EDD domain